MGTQVEPVQWEMDERNEKDNNLVFHRVEESGDGEARRGIVQDKRVKHMASRAVPEIPFPRAGCSRGLG